MKSSVQLPGAWPYIRFRYLATVHKGRLPSQQMNLSGLAELLPYLSMEYLRGELGVPLTVPTDGGSVSAQEGDILLLWDGANAGEFMLARRGIVSSTAALVVPLCVDKRFLFWACKAREAALRAETVGMGIPHVNADILANLLLPLPTRCHQHAIADFLDRETAQIDALVAAKERWIELLAEKRRAVINRTVTRGLDPKAPLRDSGIPWLGVIPEHWTTKRLKFLAAEPLAYGANESASEVNASFPRFVRITDVDENGGLRDDTFRSLPPDVAKPYLLRDGDLLLARSGATVGKALLYRSTWGTACFAGYLIRLRCDNRVLLPEFVYAFTQAEVYWAQIGEGTIQATIQNFSAERYGDLILALPPLAEQQAIVTRMAAETAKLNALRAAAERTIALLKERRAALITTAVTGKFEVA